MKNYMYSQNELLNNSKTVYFTFTSYNDKQPGKFDAYSTQGLHERYKEMITLSTTYTSNHKKCRYIYIFKFFKIM